MRYVHTITISVFTRAPEEMREIETACRAFLPDIDWEKQKLFWSEEKCTGMDGNEPVIIVGKVVLTKEAHTNTFLRTLKARLSSADRNDLSMQENRLDDDLNFFLRLSKPNLLKGTCILTDGGDCVHLKLHVAAFPTRKEVAWAVMHSFWG